MRAFPFNTGDRSSEYEALNQLQAAFVELTPEEKRLARSRGPSMFLINAVDLENVDKPNICTGTRRRGSRGRR